MSVRPADNTAWGLVEFGLVFALHGAWPGGVLGLADAGGCGPALAGGAVDGADRRPLIWYAVRAWRPSTPSAGRPRRRRSCAPRATTRTSRRSGMSDFKVFAMQDFLGAGFYHLLLSPVFGLILGGLGAAPGPAAAALERRPRGRLTLLHGNPTQASNIMTIS